MLKLVITVCFFICSTFSFSEEISANNLLKLLASEKFKERESAQAELCKYAEKNGVGLIYHAYLNSEDPEVRKRCYQILRSQSDKDYLKDGQGYLGVQMREEIILLEGDERPRVCIRIIMVVSSGPADKSGIKLGDLIVSINQEKWYEPNLMDSLIKKISEMKPMQTLQMRIQRTGEAKLLDMPVTLGKRPVEDLRMIHPDSVVELEENARQKHFEEWLKVQQIGSK